MMRRLLGLGACVLFSISLAACGGGDSASADAAPAHDARPVQRTDRAYLVRTVNLPTSEEEVEASSYQFEFKEWPVNRVGRVTTILLELVLGVPVQQNINDAFASGDILMLYIIRSADFDEDDDQVSIWLAYAEDVDDNPDNNFDGTGQVRIKTGETPVLLGSTYATVGGKLQGTGDDIHGPPYLLRFHPDHEPTPAPGVYSSVDLTIDEDGFSGVSASLVETDEFRAAQYPGIAALLTYAIAQDVQNKDDIIGIFDTDPADNEITVDELYGAATLDSLTKADVDVDGDEVPDHLSQGVMVEAVRVELVTE